MTTAETTKLLRASAYSTLLCVLHVLYRQGMHTHHIKLRGNWKSPTNQSQPQSTTTTTNTHKVIFTTTFFLCTHLLNTPHHAGKCRSEQDFNHNHRRFALFSLRWITNNNYYIFFWETSKRESEVFRRFAFSFFLCFLLPLT